jgi:segregation and condensation protein B
VAELGRRQTVGLPIEYGTTFRFLEYFGLADLGELPPEEDLALDVTGLASARIESSALPTLPEEFRAAIGAVHANGVGDA